MARMSSTERRAQLIEAAIRAMALDGVAKTTTRSIVAEAGVSLSVFHYCFDSKEALLQAVIETINEHSVSLVMATMQPGDSLRDNIRGGLQVYWDHVLSNPAEHMLTYELTQYAVRQPGFEHLARTQYSGYTESCRGLIEVMVTQTGHELTVSPDVLARLLTVLTDGLTLNFLVLGDEQSASRVLDLVADLVATLARPTTPASADT